MIIKYNSIVFQIHLNTLDYDDILTVISKIYQPHMSKKSFYFDVAKVVKFCMRYINKNVNDFNLRTIMRWVDVTIELNCEIWDHISLMLGDGLLQRIQQQNFLVRFCFYFFILSLYFLCNYIIPTTMIIFYLGIL